VSLAIPLTQLSRCFEAVLPGMMTTCSRDGTPNLIAVSYVHRIDDTHVAISRQFFKKTHQNLLDNPQAQIAVMDPMTIETYRLDLKYLREEPSGPLFDILRARVDAVASQTGMAGVFRVAAAVVFEVLAVEHVKVLDAPVHHAPAGLTAIDSMTQLRALRRISDLARSLDRSDALLEEVLAILDEVLGFSHSMILLVDETGDRLYAIASRGYAQSGIGAEVRIGEGIIGAVAQTRRSMRLSSLDRDLRYARATRDANAKDEIALPGLSDARSHLALPLVVKDELLGVIAVESRHLLHYNERDEAFLDVVASNIALALQSLFSEEARDDVPSGPPKKFMFYPHDDCVFLDGEYLIRNIPGRILWKLLGVYTREGRTEFSNRELRLDRALGLPELRANLESRLILLRKRLDERCANVRIVPTMRGHFRLEVTGTIELAICESEQR
jgi:adenylate cyclase